LIFKAFIFKLEWGICPFLEKICFVYFIESIVFEQEKALYI
jgi:hypothetical protein